MSVEEAIDAYLADVVAEMRGTFWEHQAVRAELRAHIEALVSEYTRHGLMPSAAARQALRDLGHPSDVGAVLRTSRGRRVLGQAILNAPGAVQLARSRRKAAPPALLMLALVGLVASSAAIALAYVWP